jgi:hypothetical protein
MHVYTHKDISTCTCIWIRSHLDVGWSVLLHGALQLVPLLAQALAEQPVLPHLTASHKEIIDGTHKQASRVRRGLGPRDMRHRPPQHSSSPFEKPTPPYMIYSEESFMKVSNVLYVPGLRWRVLRQPPWQPPIHHTQTQHIGTT